MIPTMPHSPGRGSGASWRGWRWPRRRPLAWRGGGSISLYGPLGWVASAATVGGVFATVLMAGALMGLAFLSSGSGHDESVRDFEAD